MAKAATKEVETTTLPATTSASYEVPAELAGMMEADRGKGVSTDQSDNLVPLIYVLQDMSPQCIKRDASYIDGAEPGMFWLRNASTPLVSGEEGILVQPCYFSKDWIEWRPRESGGGFIKRHDALPEEAVERRDPQNENKIRFALPNGNEVIETRSHVLRVKLPDGNIVPFIISFSSTGHTTSRSWMFMMNGHNGAPSFARWYKLVTREKSNAAGTWFAVDVKDAGWVKPDDYKAGRALHEAFASGQKQAAAPEAGATVAAERPGRGMDDEIPF